jgi:hypothetical protein
MDAPAPGAKGRLFKESGFGRKPISLATVFVIYDSFRVIYISFGIF